MRVACVLITHLRAKAEMRRRPHLKGRAALIVDRNPSIGIPVVVDRFPEASGVVIGMTQEQAVSRHASAVVLDADEPYYRRIFGRVLTSLQGISDRVEGAETGTAYVRVDGLEELYRGEAGVVSTLLNAVPEYLNPRVGIADAKFPAFVAARTSRAFGASGVPDDVRGFLAPHPVELLPVSTDVKIGLRRFGLHTMGSAASMREHVLSDQFGSDGRRVWALSNGIDDRPVVPIAFEESIVEHTPLPYHSSSMQVLFVAVDALLRRAYARPEMRGRYVGAVSLECTASRSQPWEKVVRFKQPASTWETASVVVRSQIEADPPQITVEDVTLTLSGFAGESGTQMGLLKDVHEGRRRLEEVERQLRERMNGEHALYRIAEVAPWHPAPDMRALQVPIDPSGADAIKPLHLPRPVEVQEGTAREPVSVCLERRWQQVALISDTWTFDLWWLPEPVARSYYRVDPGDGRQVTLFRDRMEGRWYRQSA